MRNTDDYDSIQEARRALADGETTVAFYVVTVVEAKKDREISAALGARALRSAELAEEAGFGVSVEIQEWRDRRFPAASTEDIFYARWRVTVPPQLDKQLAALVWDNKAGHVEHMLTRSTRHSGWQLTNFDASGEPWGHREIYGDASEAFDARVMASGIPLPGLVQVIFRDGRVLVREGVQQIAFNPKSRPHREPRKKVGNVRDLVARALR